MIVDYYGENNSNEGAEINITDDLRMALLLPEKMIRLLSENVKKYVGRMMKDEVDKDYHLSRKLARYFEYCTDVELYRSASFKTIMKDLIDSLI